MDTSCGDTDMDGIMACHPDDLPDLMGCDCDDSRMDVRPPFGLVPGAVELCDGRDNDCNRRIDETAECCAGCASLGAERNRADICTEDGTCVCSTEGDGSAPCASGQTCCTAGCTDTQSDMMNCGFCRVECGGGSDRCTAGSCTCGTMVPCDYITMCVDGVCGG
jgi:hypothetical protein